MILPSKTVKPIDSLLCISACIIQVMEDKLYTVDQVLSKVNGFYPKSINIETLLLCLNYLYIIGKLESENGTIKIKL